MPKETAQDLYAQQALKMIKNYHGLTSIQVEQYFSVCEPDELALYSWLIRATNFFNSLDLFLSKLQTGDEFEQVPSHHTSPELKATAFGMNDEKITKLNEQIAKIENRLQNLEKRSRWLYFTNFMNIPVIYC